MSPSTPRSRPPVGPRRVRCSEVIPCPRAGFGHLHLWDQERDAGGQGTQEVSALVTGRSGGRDRPPGGLRERKVMEKQWRLYWERGVSRAVHSHRHLLSPCASAPGGTLSGLGVTETDKHRSVECLNS